MAESSTASGQAAPAAPHHALRECHDCGQFQLMPALPPGRVAHCIRCEATLRRRMRRSFAFTTALMFAGLAMLVIILLTPLIDISLLGREQGTTLAAMPLAFEPFGMWELTFLVLMFTLLVPLAKVLLTLGILIGLRFELEPSWLATMARIRAWLGPWAMTEVFLLGMFVAYTRLIAYASVQIGPALYAVGGLMLVMVASDAWLDEHAFWDEIARRRERGPQGDGILIGCDTCGHVSRGRVGDLCFCCESRLRVRKPDPVTRSWALMLAAAALYIPANLLPVMSLVRLGQTTTTTILGGVQELIAAEMWPLALLVFVASIVVPMAKLLLLAYMLLTTQRRSPRNLRQRTSMYRLVDAIGRWSMIDVFMISILTALVRMDVLASVIPENGAICFAGVVVVTMLAAACFDPRIMWDAAEAAEPADAAPAHTAPLPA